MIDVKKGIGECSITTDQVDGQRVGVNKEIDQIALLIMIEIFDNDCL